MPTGRRRPVTGEATPGSDTPGSDRRPVMGRPRAADRTPAILEAATDLLGEVGYDRLRIQDVADRAGAGLATLYRRWPTKQALVADAISHYTEGLLVPVQDDPMADLSALYRAMIDKMGGKGGEVLPGLISALRMEPELAEVVRNRVIAPLRERELANLSRVLGADNPFLDSLVDCVPALALFRTVVLGEVVTTDEFLRKMLDLIATLAPV